MRPGVNHHHRHQSDRGEGGGRGGFVIRPSCCHVLSYWKCLQLQKTKNLPEIHLVLHSKQMLISEFLNITKIFNLFQHWLSKVWSWSDQSLPSPHFSSKARLMCWWSTCCWGSQWWQSWLWLAPLSQDQLGTEITAPAQPSQPIIFHLWHVPSQAQPGPTVPAIYSNSKIASSVSKVKFLHKSWIFGGWRLWLTGGYFSEWRKCLLDIQFLNSSPEI